FTPTFQTKSSFRTTSTSMANSSPLFTKSPILRVMDAVPSVAVAPVDNGIFTSNNKSLERLSKYSKVKFTRLNNLPSKATVEDWLPSQLRSGFPIFDLYKADILAFCPREYNAK